MDSEVLVFIYPLYSDRTLEVAKNLTACPTARNFC